LGKSYTAYEGSEGGAPVRGNRPTKRTYSFKLLPSYHKHPNKDCCSVMKDLAVASPAAVGYCDNDSVTVRHGESGNGEEGRKVRR